MPKTYFAEDHVIIKVQVDDPERGILRCDTVFEPIRNKKRIFFVLPDQVIDHETVLENVTVHFQDGVFSFPIHGYSSRGYTTPKPWLKRIMVRPYRVVIGAYEKALPRVCFSSKEFWQLCERIGLLRYAPWQTRHGVTPQDTFFRMAADSDEGIVMTLLREELERLTKDSRAQEFLIRQYGEAMPRKDQADA